MVVCGAKNRRAAIKEFLILKNDAHMSVCIIDSLSANPQEETDKHRTSNSPEIALAQK
jgi:hypothetical protein